MIVWQQQPVQWSFVQDNPAGLVPTFTLTPDLVGIIQYL